MAKKKSGRASNGMGSVRQRSDGRWEARYSTPDGKQRSVYGKSEKEVTAKLRGVLHEIDSGSWTEPSKMTVGEWLDIWLEDYQTETSERTVYKYRCISNRHFKKHLGDIKVTKLMSYHVRRMITAMQSEGLSDPTIKNYIGILETAMQRAVEHKVIASNPVIDVRVKSEPPKPFCVIDRADIPRFAKAVKDIRYGNELKIMLYAGLRVGEVRGLRWSDIDFEAGTIHVQRQLQPKRKGLKRITLPKFNKRREFHVAQNAMDVFKAQKKLQTENRLRAGANWHEDDECADFVFRQPNGRPHGEHTIYFAAKQLGEIMGLPDLHPHDLRHSYAIAALRSGVDVKTVQHNLGHATAKMTLDVYAAYTNDAGVEGAKKLSEYLQSAQNEAD